MIDKFENSNAYDALISEGMEAKKNGLPIHRNPYDYKFEAIAANLWDEGWKKEK